MKRIKVNLSYRSYYIKIGKGILSEINFSKFGNSKYAIVTDSNVKSLYGKNLQDLLMSQGLSVDLFTFPAGEKSKTPERAIEIGRELAKRKFDRNSIIVALGGGVVGDLAGYVASFYQRGIDYIHIPTTLLAQVDSSIGGKTGVDIPGEKICSGLFISLKKLL
jgi:3-dehydroquinate synthase